MMHRSMIKATLIAATLLCVPFSLQAKEADSRLLVYISPNDYKHPVRLSHFNFREYWFSQGAAIEPIAATAFSREFGEFGMCEAGKTGNTVVWLKPSMTYNSQLRTFNGKITADVYSGSGKVMGSYVGEGRQDSHVDIVPAYQVDVTFKRAMHNLVNQMKADRVLEAAMRQALPSGETATSCAMVSLFPVRN